jgi:hypothetical protein
MPRPTQVAHVAVVLLLAYEDTSSLPCRQRLDAEQFYTTQPIALPLNSMR